MVQHIHTQKHAQTVFMCAICSVHAPTCINEYTPLNAFRAKNTFVCIVYVYVFGYRGMFFHYTGDVVCVSFQNKPKFLFKSKALMILQHRSHVFFSQSNSTVQKIVTQ